MYKKDMTNKEGYLHWNSEYRRMGCWNPQWGWLELFHCGDCFYVANGVGYDTENPVKWTDCSIERILGKWGEGKGYVLVNLEEKILDDTWLEGRKIRLE